MSWITEWKYMGNTGCVGITGNVLEILDIWGLIMGISWIEISCVQNNQKNQLALFLGTYWDLKDLKDFTGFFAGEKHKKWMSPTAKTPEIQCVIHWGYTRGISRSYMPWSRSMGQTCYRGRLWWNSWPSPQGDHWPEGSVSFESRSNVLSRCVDWSWFINPSNSRYLVDIFEIPDISTYIYPDFRPQGLDRGPRQPHHATIPCSRGLHSVLQFLLACFVAQPEIPPIREPVPMDCFYMFLQGGAPTVISWFINHSKYRYNPHKA